MFVFLFFTSICLSLFFTYVVRHIMIAKNIVDHPKVDRKIHKSSIALGGGWAIYASLFLIIWGVFGTSDIFGDLISGKILLGLAFGGLILMLGGFLDDKYSLSPFKQLFFPVLAALIVICFGIGEHIITSPIGGTLRLDQFIISFGNFGNIVLFADLVLFLWLMGMMYTTKILDGLDGLVTGVVAIGALIIFILSLQPQWYQIEVATLAIVFAGSCIGFLLLNFHPAKIFLGEGGSLFTGFFLGVLAVISGGKIATTVLVMGFPILDIARVLFTRYKKKKSLFSGDKEHLHFQMLQSGLSHRKTVLLFYTISLFFGITTLFLQARQKLIALLFLFILMLLLVVWFSSRKK